VERYADDLGRFRSLGYHPIVSPGAWCWSRFFPAYHKAEANIASLLSAARRAGVRGALNTHWGDDGHECFFDYALPAHVYFLAECTENPGNKKGMENAKPAMRSGNAKGAKSAGALEIAKRRFRAVFGEDFDAVRSTEKIDLAWTRPGSETPANIGKCFFYDDPAQGLFSGLSSVRPAGRFYARMARDMEARAGGRSSKSRESLFRPLFVFAAAFCDFLAVKSDLRRKAVAAYRKHDKRALRAVLGDISKAETRLETVRVLYRSLWLRERSPFGLEIVDGRMGALAARLDYLRHILSEHVAGSMARLEELEFPHFSLYHGARGADGRPAAWPEFMLNHSALASRNTIKWW
jgi:hypothetical protein